MSSHIQNIDDLRAEIKLLKLQKAEHELYFSQKKESIRQTFSSPFAFFRNIKSLIGSDSSRSNFIKDGASHQQSDWATSIARLVIPFFLNRTVLRGKGVVIKSLLGLISQKAINGETFNKVKIASWIDKATNWVNSTIKKPRKKQRVDYGIPPDSETY